MELRDYVRTLRRHWRLIALFTLLAVGTAAAFTYSSSKVYTSSTQLFVSTRDSATGEANINTAYQGGLFTQQRVKSYRSVLSSEHVANLVRQDLGLRESADYLAKEISASAPLDTVLLNVKVSDRDPELAQRIADSIGRVFPKLVDQLEAPTGGGISPVKVSVVQPAQEAKQTSPRPNFNLALGLLIGLAVGVGGAVARETLDAAVHGPEQAAELAGAPIIGAITFDADAAKTPLVVVSSPGSPRAEAFRQLRTNLQFVDIEHPLRSVVITSSVSGEGKSTTTCNLAITLAEAGLRVILVEADLRRPRVADYMGLEGAVGLTSALLGRVDLDTALQPWRNLSLSVLPSGPLPPNPSELLGSTGMRELLRELEERADIVLLDAPPLLPVTDAAVLGASASGVILLIRSSKTRREQVHRSASILASVGATPLGAVLNMVPTRGPDAYAYGYGYGYGYGYRPDATGSRLSTAESAVRPAPRPAVAVLTDHVEPTEEPEREPEPEPTPHHVFDQEERAAAPPADQPGAPARQPQQAPAEPARAAAPEGPAPDSVDDWWRAHAFFERREGES